MAASAASTANGAGTSTGGNQGDLAHTGSDLSVWAIGGALGALGLGAALMLLIGWRRRRASEEVEHNHAH
jgi:hypothetical protein